MLISQTTFLDEIFKLEKNKEKSEHIKITNISYWNSSSAYKQYMEKFILLDFQQDIFDYTYTYDITKYQRLQIMKKLKALNPNDTMCLLSSSGTNSILNAVNYLKLHNYEKLAILLPSYYAVEQCCQIYNIAYEKVNMQYLNGQYEIPLKYLLEHYFDAVWLTSPVYSTGISYNNCQINDIKKLITNNILVIADETLAMPNQMLIRKIPINDYFFSICCPHKPLFINKMKFSAFICPKKNDDFLEQWVDILSGSLLFSNLMAIQHFLSDNFNECIKAAQHWYKNTINEVCHTVQQFPGILYNLDETGPYKTIYLTTPGIEIEKLDNINSLIVRDYISYIPLKFNGYGGFRINLSLNPADLSNALYRILKFYT